MRHKSMVRIILDILAMVMLTLILSSSVWPQVTFKTLYKFKGGKDGNAPLAGLIFDQAGNLYGTTVYGGHANSGGAVFQLTPDQNGRWTESVLYSFCSLTNCADGGAPQAGLIFDQAGNLFGTTIAGGLYGNGAVFQLTPNQNGGWTESALYSFCSLANCADGADPQAGLTFDQAGNLYGTTGYGGAHGVYGVGGTVFKLTPNQNGRWTEHVLYSFCSRPGCVDGVQPFAGLIFDQAGNLYGTTEYGGAAYSNNASGTVFKLIRNQNGGWTESVLYSFCSRLNCTDGSYPQAGLIFDQAGNLCGTNAGGGHGYGTVFQLTPNQNGGWTEHVLHAFMDQPGALSAAGLILDQAGNLYGTTSGDGSTTFGSVFEITP
jgi:uncharacterized repeat protein (TIGR03803 family)